MKKIYSAIILVILFCVAACTDSGSRNSAAVNSNNGAQNSSDRGQAVLQMDGGAVSIEYGRPELKGRDLEKMISPGQEWRMGSNAATTLTTDVDLRFGDKVIPRGKYVLKAKADDQRNWYLLVDTEDQTRVAEIPLNLQKVDRPTELMTIDLVKRGNGGTFVLHWGNLSLSSDFEKA
jgi:Protein of unknown function (DUF2911)